MQFEIGKPLSLLSIAIVYLLVLDRTKDNCDFIGRR